MLFHKLNFLTVLSRKIPDWSTNNFCNRPMKQNLKFFVKKRQTSRKPKAGRGDFAFVTGDTAF